MGPNLGASYPSIHFTAEGDFTERSLLKYTNWELEGDQEQRRGVVVASGSGQYAIPENSLELRYDGGLIAYRAIWVPLNVPLGPSPASLYISRTCLDLAR